MSRSEIFVVVNELLQIDPRNSGCSSDVVDVYFDETQDFKKKRNTLSFSIINQKVSARKNWSIHFLREEVKYQNRMG